MDGKKVVLKASCQFSMELKVLSGSGDNVQASQGTVWLRREGRGRVGGTEGRTGCWLASRGFPSLTVHTVVVRTRHSAMRLRDYLACIFDALTLITL